MSLIRYNDDYSKYEVVLPDGTHMEAEEVPEDGVDLIEHPDDPKQNFIVFLKTYDEEQSNIEPDSLYLMAPILDVETEEGCDFEEEDEAEAGPEPAEE